MPVTDWLVAPPCFIEGKTCFAGTGSTKRVSTSLVDPMPARQRVSVRLSHFLSVLNAGCVGNWG